MRPNRVIVGEGVTDPDRCRHAAGLLLEEPGAEQVYVGQWLTGPHWTDRRTP